MQTVVSVGALRYTTAMRGLEPIDQIANCDDLLERALRLAGLVTALFKAEGWDLVVVGGSAVEFNIRDAVRALRAEVANGL